MLTETSTPRLKIIALSVLVLAALAAVRPASGDDRNTVRNSAGNPYVFIILDTSGSMNWAPPCSAADFAAGNCPFLCPTGDCYVPLQADDPNSKLYQAKAALHNVIKKEGSVHYGFASYNQDALGMRGKHYLYEAATAGPLITGFGTWPTPSVATPWREVFGYLGAGPVWACNSGSGDNLAGCGPTTPADVTKPYQLTRVKRLPKGDAAFNVAQTIYVLVSGSTYKITYTPTGSPTPGAATITTSVFVGKCSNPSCSSTTGNSTVTVTWNRVLQAQQRQKDAGGNPVDVQTGVLGDFISWDVGAGQAATLPQETDPGTTYFSQAQAADALVNAASTCLGWDPNTDSAADQALATIPSIRQPTDGSDPRGGGGVTGLFSVGDVVPWDWLNDHNLDIRKRMAPNLELNPAAAPDFSTASYFNNTPWAGETLLRVPGGNAAKDTVAVKSLHAPLIAGGATPIGASLQSFRQWFSGCTSGTCSASAGWKAVAGAVTGDPLYKCSRKYVLFITDGDETCNPLTGSPPNGLPCTVAADLNTKDGVKTYILGYGVPSATANALTCVATNGGTVSPLLPSNQAALEAELENLFGNIMENPTAFSSAAVPSVQAETSQKLYHTSFFPLNDQGIWDGHVNAFLKPLPLTPATGPVRVPDTSRVCNSSITSSCLLWDAGVVLQGQAPSLTDVTGNNFKIGNGAAQRRVFYSYANPNGEVPGTVRTFTPPAGNAPSADWNDLLCGQSSPCPMAGSPLPTPTGLAYTIPGSLTQAQAQAAATAVIKNTLQVKTANVTFTDGNNVTHSFTEPYVLGDIFHSDPLFYSNPDNFLYYAADFGVGTTSSKACTGLVTDNTGYRCYAERHRKRRKMLVFGANDGQLHAFDSGTWQTSGAQANQFSNGTGTEVFAYVPRLALPVLRDQAASGSTTQIYSVDGTVRVDDVFIDPRHTAAAGPDATKREWRTVLIGGMREGGKPNRGTSTQYFVSGYYALDLTDPDTIGTKATGYLPGSSAAVAGCLDASNLNTPTAACGTNPFAVPLWEFTDSISWSNGTSIVTSQLDEDTVSPGKNAPDLGQTWSVPTVGVIKVTEGTAVVNKFVAIFGGGFDLNSKTIPPTSPTRGNWIYIVDIETGKAIYKHAVNGSVVGDPAVVDTNQDGYLDTIYFGTTSGFLYKMDLTSPELLKNYTLPLAAGIPAFTTAQIVKRVGSITPAVASAWDPFPIFNTGGLPIYLTPTTFFVADLGQYAITFGTGDREDLWSPALSGSTPIGGTFNLILDENFTSATGGLPKTAASYEPVTSTGAKTGMDFVLSPQGGRNRGWVMTLQSQERVITQAFGLGGILLFSTYAPDPLQPDANGQCAFLGDSHNFVVFANNSDPVAVVSGVETKFTVVTNKFVTNPFIEQGATKNAPAANTNSEQLDLVQQGILAKLQKLCPKGSKFGNYWVSVSGVRSDTGYVRYGTIPICIASKNWKEY